MGPKKLYIWVYVILGLLGLSFLVVAILACVDEEMKFIATISGISSFFVAVLTALYVYTTTKQIELVNRQLEEMEFDRALKEQPLLVPVEETGSIECPQLFFTPLGEYLIHSRYFYRTKIKNVSNYPATSVDISAVLQIPTDENFNEYYEMYATTRRINVVAAHSESEEIEIMFAMDEKAAFFDAIRDQYAELLPKIRVSILYKNMCGGYFKTETESYLVPQEEDEPDIKMWHTQINGALAEYKEEIESMKQYPVFSEQRVVIFNAVQGDFAKKVGPRPEISIQCKEIKEEFLLEVISKEEYTAEMQTHSYGRFVHKQGSCARLLKSGALK